MNLKKVMDHRSVLLQQIELQREDIRHLSQSLEHPASLIDRAYSFTQRVRSHPTLVVGGALMFFMVGRRFFPYAKLKLGLMTAAKLWFFLRKPNAQLVRK